MVLLNQFGISAGYGKIKMHMKNSNQNANKISATCPACGLLCDDILVSTNPQLSVEKACSKGVSFFQRANINTENVSPSIGGQPCNLDAAVNKVVEILSDSSQPLIAGLGTEVNGARSVIRLAQKINASLDHMHSESGVHHTRALQNGGWITTTLAEVKNRADLILAIGTDISSTHPRFFERLTDNSDSLFRTQAAEIVYLGSEKNSALNQASLHALPSIVSALNALLQGKKLINSEIGGMPLEALQSLAEKLKNAKYAVIVWSAGALQMAHAELLIQSITQLIAKLNETTRAAGLPLNSGDGDTSVNNTSTWLCGYPTRLRFTNGIPDYNTARYATAAQLNSGDALLWISCFNPHLPPSTELPTIVIGHPAMQFEKTPDVFIPVGVPGFDTEGLMLRMDSSITLPLKKLRNSTLPTLSNVIAMLEAKLAAGVSA